MSEYAVVLQNNMVVKSADFGDLDTLAFTNDGKIRSFIYQGVNYYAVFEFSTSIFIDYVNAVEFDKLIANEKKREGANYSGVSTRAWKNPKSGLDITFKKYAELHAAISGDTIYGYLRDETGLCFNNYIWTYTLPYTGPSGYVKAPNATPLGQNCEVLTEGSFPQQFYNAFSGKTFYDLNTDTAAADQRLVGEITVLMKSVDSTMLTAFRGFVAAGVDTGQFTFSKNETGSYSRQELLDYKNGLERWLQIFKENQKEIEKLTDLNEKDKVHDIDERLYIICDLLYRYNMLADLTVKQKIAVLKVLSQGRLMDWYFASFKNGFQQRETLAVKIIQSVTATQATEFLEGLIKTIVNSTTTRYSAEGTPIESVTEKVTLYKNLFYKVDDFFGKPNFTAFIKALQRLVLAKSGINLPSDGNKIDYTLDELKEKTDKLFLWGNIRNENKIKYSIASEANEKILFAEQTCTRINKIEVQNTTSAGIPTNTSYTIAICANWQKINIEVGHFDLVGIYFYDNPSFIDLGSDTSYKEQVFLTFGGFVDYLLEKENTKLVQDVLVAGLTLLTMAVGAGEVVAAIRGANYLRLMVGIGTVVGDVSLYLAQNTAFRNYIIEEYPEDYDKILTVMALAGTVMSLGGSSVIGSGILKTYSSAQAAEFLGIARQVLADSEAVAKLTANEKTILENGVKIFENGLYRIRYDVEIAKDVNRAKAIIKFYDNAALRAEIFALDETSRLNFLNDFNDISVTLTNLLKENPKAVGVWVNLKAAGRANVKENLFAFLGSFHIRPLLLNEEYVKVAQYYDRVISPAYEVPDLPGIKWIVDGTPSNSALINANNVANDSNDISVIAGNYNVPLPIMERAKAHYWSDVQMVLVEGGTFQIGRFEKDVDDIDEWAAAIANTLSNAEEVRFRRTIAHEYIEAKLMDRGMNFRAFLNRNSYTASDFGAHELAPLISSGEFIDLNRLTNPPAIDYETFSNLNDVVEFYINFYKL